MFKLRRGVQFGQRNMGFKLENLKRFSYQNPDTIRKDRTCLGHFSRFHVIILAVCFCSSIYKLEGHEQGTIRKFDRLPVEFRKSCWFRLSKSAGH